MSLRARRRKLVVWSSSAGPDSPACRGRDLGLTRPARFWRTRRRMRTVALLAAIGLIRLGTAARPRWRPLLAGAVLTVAGIMLRSGAAGVIFVPGMLFLLSAVLVPVDPEEARARRRELERELAAYFTPAQRCDLEATLDRYPDSVTCELRDILTRQAASAGPR